MQTTRTVDRSDRRPHTESLFFRCEKLRKESRRVTNVARDLREQSRQLVQQAKALSDRSKLLREQARESIVHPTISPRPAVPTARPGGPVPNARRVPWRRLQMDDLNYAFDIWSGNVMPDFR